MKLIIRLCLFGFMAAFLSACATTEEVDAMTQPIPMDDPCDGKLQPSMEVSIFSFTFGDDEEEKEKSPPKVEYECIRHIDNEVPPEIRR